MINKAFYKAFDKLTNRLLLEEDYKNLSNTSLEQIKRLISYYQITNRDEKKKKTSYRKINVFFDKKNFNLVGWQIEDIYQNLSMTFISSVKINQNVSDKIFELPERKN